MPETEQHSFVKTVVLHLLPGIPITLFYFLTAPYFVKLGFPPAFALCLAIPIVLIPLELGYLYYLAKKTNNSLSLKNIILYQEHVPVPHIIGYVLILVAWSALCFVVLSKPVGGFISETFFSWAPAWYVENSFEGTKSILLVTWIMVMVFGSILGPLVEELYFRGYLMPRISRYKAWAPLLNAFLFALYHFWTPWEVITRTAAVFPLSLVVYKKKNIYIGIAAHIMLNILSTLSLLALIFK